MSEGHLDPVGAASAWAYGWGWSLVMGGFVGIALVSHVPIADRRARATGGRVAAW